MPAREPGEACRDARPTDIARDACRGAGLGARGWGSAPGESGAERPKVSLTMIVRDEQRNLPHCLESVRGLFDEIVVVDTGSKDRTIEIARSFGAGV